MTREPRDRKSHDREDLMAEATALVRRTMFRLPDQAEPIVVGFRANGCASFYFGADPVYHFNSTGQLRRAFVADRLLKAEQARLASLVRSTVAGELRRHDLTEIETSEFLRLAHNNLARLANALRRGDALVVSQVPTEVDLRAEVLAWLDRVGGALELANSPHAR